MDPLPILGSLWEGLPPPPSTPPQPQGGPINWDGLQNLCITYKKSFCLMVEPPTNPLKKLFFNVGINMIENKSNKI